MVDLQKVRPEDLWYTVGLIATDGNLSLDGRHIAITSKDIDFLENVKKALFLENKMSFKARGGETEKKYGHFQFGDVRFYHFLLSLGLTPRKSLTMGPLNIPEPYFNDFLRGVIDGDGNIRQWIHPQNGGQQWALRIFSGAPKFSTWLLATTQRQFAVKGVQIIQHPKAPSNPQYILKFGKMAARTILKQCYYTNALALERKRQLAQECIASYVGWRRSLTVQTRIFV